MVRSMIAGVAGLKSHQSKLDVIGNNIANVNTWGFKSFSYNFMDSKYTNSINSTGGSMLAGAAGGRNASQVGYGSQLSSISTEFTTGAPAPSSNPMDCMIDGTGFFLVGNMVNGTFTNVASSGLYLSRVGIFRVDDNGYLVDNQRNYVYGYSVEQDTGIPEKPATASSTSLKDIKAEWTEGYTDAGGNNVPGRNTITIAGISVPTSATSKNDLEDAVNDWVSYVTANAMIKNPAYETDQTQPEYIINTFNGQNGDGTAANPSLDFSKVNISLDAIGRDLDTASLTVTAKATGDTMAQTVTPITTKMINPTGGNNPGDSVGTVGDQNQGNDLVPGVSAIYSDDLSTLRIPVDPDTGMRYEIQSYRINEDGTIIGTDNQNRTIPIGQLALVTVENPNGLEKTDGYYYTPGANAGQIEAMKPNGGPSGKIRGGYLEMANTDLANEFSNMITTQRGFQANSKIITVTDEMLQELVNMKR